MWTLLEMMSYDFKGKSIISLVSQLGFVFEEIENNLFSLGSLDDFKYILIISTCAKDFNTLFTIFSLKVNCL